MADQVSSTQGMTQHREIGTIGYIVGTGASVLLLPALPFLIALYLLQRATGGRGEPGSN